MKAFKTYINVHCAYLSFSKTQLLLVAENGEKGKESGIVDAAGPLLRYLAELTTALKYSSDKECPPSPSLCPVDGDSMLQDVESDWMDDMGGDDEDSGGEESVSERKFCCKYFCSLLITFSPCTCNWEVYNISISIL